METVIPKNGGIRNQLSKIFSDYLDKLESDDISVLLSKIIRPEEDTDYIIINDVENSQLVGIPQSYLDLYYNPIHKHRYFLKKTRAQTSRQLWIKNEDGSEINTNLRIRLTLNNGITALLGRSAKNKSSVPCLKIQQDSVNTFINNCTNRVIVKY